MTIMMRGCAVAVVAWVAGVAGAVQPAAWVHNTEADFEGGQREHTVVTNLGDLQLAVGTSVVGTAPEPSSVIYDVQVVGAGDAAAVYVAAGPEGRVLKRDGEKLEAIVTLEKEQVFTLDALGDTLLVGVSGETSRLALLHDGKLVDVVKLEGVRYVWDVAVVGRDVYLATGTDGKVIRVVDVAGYAAAVRAGARAEPPAPPAMSEVLDSAQANVLCLAWDAPRRRLFAGTDTDGLVYRLTLPAEDAEGDAARVQTFVVYDAPEPEVGTLLVLGDGTVCAGTADAEQAKPGRLTEAAAEQGGRPGAGGAAAGAGEKPAVPGEGEGEQPPEPGDLPGVPPKAPPVGEPEGEQPGVPGPGDAVPGDDAADAEPDGQPAAAPPVDGGSPRRDAVGFAEDAQGADDAPPAPAPAPTPDAADAPPDADAPANAADAALDAPADATPAQLDQLRTVIRQRLDAARRSGTLQAGANQPRARRAAAGPGRPSGPTPPGKDGQPPREGNAVYRIDTAGFVSEVFRESVMILKLVPTGDQLLVLTGSEGEVFRVDPAAEETTILVDLEPEQATSAVTLADGQVLLGTANPATLVQLVGGFAPTGQFSGVVLDATQISLWGKLRVWADTPPGTSVTVLTRSGNVNDPEDAAWSPWAQAGRLNPEDDTAPLAPRELTILSPPARFLQYRLQLAGDAAVTPSVDRIELAYVTPNIRPAIASITARYPDAAPAGGPGGGARPGPKPPGAPGGGGAAPGDEPPSTVVTVEWEAADPNGDTLTFHLDYQPAGFTEWIKLEADLAAGPYEWQTRRVPDGRYRVRVTASDAADNPGDMAATATRVSDPLVIDNTPPSFENLQVRRNGNRATVTGAARDALSPIQSIRYSVGAGDEQPVLPEDLIFDSTAESFTVTIADLSPGPAALTFKATDARGNVTHQALLVAPAPGGPPGGPPGAPAGTAPAPGNER